MRSGMEEPIRSKPYNEQNYPAEHESSKRSGDGRPCRFGYSGAECRDNFPHEFLGMKFLHLRASFHSPISGCSPAHRNTASPERSNPSNRGAYWVLSNEAVAELCKRGFKAFRLEEGYPEWRAAGLPIGAVSD
jgi:hypothetical protein